MNKIYLHITLLNIPILLMLLLRNKQISLILLIGYIVITFPYLLVAYLSSLEGVTKSIYEKYPDFYEKNKGVTKISKTVNYIFTPSLYNIMDKRILLDNNLITDINFVKRLIVLIPINLFLLLVYVLIIAII